MYYRLRATNTTRWKGTPNTDFRYSLKFYSVGGDRKKVFTLYDVALYGISNLKIISTYYLRLFRSRWGKYARERPCFITNIQFQTKILQLYLTFIFIKLITL